MSKFEEQAANIIKSAAASALRALPSSALPRGRIQDFRAWSDAREARLSWMEKGWDHWYLPVRGAELVEIAPPLSVDRAVHPVYRGAQFYRYPPLFLAQIRHGRIVGYEGAVLTPDGRVLEEFSFAWGAPPSQWPIFSRVRVPPMQEKPGAMLTLLSPVTAKPNYFHWWADALPRLGVAEEAGIRHFQVIVPQEMEDWQRESLDRLGVDANRQEPFGDDHWRVESLLLPSLIGYSGMMRPWAADWLRRRIGLPRPSTRRRRIYLRRTKAGYRRVANEADIVPILEQYNFEIWETQGMSLGEQMKLFSRAECVVSIHGAGLANLLFAPPGVKVIEFMSPISEYANSCYYSLCAAAGHVYGYILGEHDAVDLAAKPRSRWIIDLRVDPDKLRRMLALWYGK
jgi:capsular polysaccharide biosynthesis protein